MTLSMRMHDVCKVLTLCAITGSPIGLMASNGFVISTAKKTKKVNLWLLGKDMQVPGKADRLSHYSKRTMSVF